MNYWVKVIIPGDVNARVGPDFKSWPIALETLYETSDDTLWHTTRKHQGPDS